MRKVTRTFTRTDATMDKYMQAMNSKKKETAKQIFDRLRQESIIEFKYWSIVPNEYPYDAIAKTHHMLMLNRHIPLDWELLTDKERDEFKQIRKGYLNDNYDLIWENLPSAQSMPSIFHVHLMVLKREGECASMLALGVF